MGLTADRRGMVANFAGQARLVLRNNRYFIQTESEAVLQTLLLDPVIAAAVSAAQDAAVAASGGGAGGGGGGGAVGAARPATGTAVSAAVVAPAAVAAIAPASTAPASTPAAASASASASASAVPAGLPADLQDYLALMEQADGSGPARAALPDVEVPQAHVRAVQRACLALDHPLLSEYDYLAADGALPPLRMDLKPTAVLRPYQEMSLRKMFQHARARSGLIVLPCGAGKTLTGVTAAATIKKRTLVLCTSGVAVEQWRAEFKRWCVMDDRLVTRFTADAKDVPAENGIIISTCAAGVAVARASWP